MKKFTKLLCIALSAVCAASLAACGGKGGSTEKPDLDKGYTYEKEYTNGLMQFVSSDEDLDYFLNDYMERHLRYSDKAIGKMKVGDGSTTWKEWDAMSVMWMNTSALGYDPRLTVSNFISSIYQDDFGYVWVDNGTSPTLWGQSWEFPNAGHTQGNTHTYFTLTGGNTTKSWKAYSDFGQGFGIGAGSKTDLSTSDYITVSSDTSHRLKKATFETVVKESDKFGAADQLIGEMAKAYYAPFLEINVQMLDNDSLGHSSALKDIAVYWLEDDMTEYDDSHKVLYSEFATTKFEYMPMSSRIVFPMYAAWGKSTAKSVKGMKIEFQMNEAGLDGTVRIDRIALAVDGRQINNNGVILAAAAEYFKFSQNTEWLAKNIDKLRKALQFYTTYCGAAEGAQSHGKDVSALISKANVVGHDGSTNGKVGHAIGDGYWDCVSYPEIDLYTNIYYYKALRSMEYLERMAAAYGIEGSAVSVAKADMSGRESYAETAESIKATMDAFAPAFRDYFWNDETGRFFLGYVKEGDNRLTAGTVDEKVDYGFTKYNQDVIDLGLATDEQADSIMKWINGERTVDTDLKTYEDNGQVTGSVGEDIYKYEVAPRWTTKENVYQYWWNFDGSRNKSYGWDKQIQNGGTSLQCAYYDVAAEKAVGGTNAAYAKLKRLQAWYDKVSEAYGTGTNFYRTYYMTTDIQLQGNGRAGVFGADDEFIEAALLYAIVPYQFFGLGSSEAGTLDITPALPSGLDWWKMENLSFGGVMYDLTIGSDWVQINSVSKQSDFKVKVTLPKPAGSYTVRQHDKVLTAGTDYVEAGDVVVITAPLANGRIQTVAA